LSSSAQIYALEVAATVTISEIPEPLCWRFEEKLRASLVSAGLSSLPAGSNKAVVEVRSTYITHCRARFTLAAVDRHSGGELRVGTYLVW
jgi:hypothetical protein